MQELHPEIDPICNLRGEGGRNPMALTHRMPPMTRLQNQTQQEWEISKLFKIIHKLKFMTVITLTVLVATTLPVGKDTQSLGSL